MTDSAPTLPHPYLVDGQNHIPAPPSSSFDAEFSGLLPPGISIPSSLGSTRCYSFSPKTPSPSPSSRRILLIHGGGTPAIGLAPLALALSSKSPDTHIVIFDLYGHGLSSTPLQTHTPSIFHLQILELLSHLRWLSAHIIGFSMGGSIAASFAAIHPNAVDSVSLIAPAGLWRTSEKGLWEALSTDGWPGLEWVRRRKIMGYINGDDLVPKEGWKERLKNGKVEPVAIQNWEREEHKGHVASLVSMWNYVCFDQHESFARLNEGALKVLVVFGGLDDVIEAEQTKKELERLDWKGNVHVVEGATHEIVRSHVPEVVTLLEQFWGEL